MVENDRRTRQSNNDKHRNRATQRSGVRIVYGALVDGQTVTKRRSEPTVGEMRRTDRQTLKGAGNDGQMLMFGTPRSFLNSHSYSLYDHGVAESFLNQTLSTTTSDTTSRTCTFLLTAPTSTTTTTTNIHCFLWDVLVVSNIATNLVGQWLDRRNCIHILGA